MIRAGLLVLGLLLLSQEASALCAEDTASLRWPEGAASFAVEIADDPAERAQGLMFRENLEPSAGMLFIYERPQPAAFWMKNTLIPLQIAFVADDGTVVNLAEMKPHSLDSHCSTRPVRFVLEMNTGWFSKRGVKPGAQLRGEPFGTPR